MKYADIAEATGKTVGMIKMDAQRGKFNKSDEASIAAYIAAAHGNTEPLPVVESEKKAGKPAKKQEIKPSEKPTVDPTTARQSNEEPIEKSESYVDSHTKAADKGWLGSRDHLMSLEVGSIYRGFSNIVVEIREDPLGNKFMKMLPKAVGPFVKDKK